VGALTGVLGLTGTAPFIVYRAFVLVKIGLRRPATINVQTTDLPLVGFCLLMV
jgi:hypothetical protein